MKALLALSLALNLLFGFHLWRLANLLLQERQTCIAIAADLKAQGEAWAAKARTAERHGNTLYEATFRKQKELAERHRRLMRRG